MKVSELVSMRNEYLRAIVEQGGIPDSIQLMNLDDIEEKITLLEINRNDTE